MYERGVALFELCRFDEARRTFEKVLAETPDHAHALYHLGLIEERLGNPAAAARHLAAATAADPKSFPAAPEIPANDFAARVQRAVAALPPDFRRDLSSVRVEAADLPELDDLTAEKPPLSPTILGLFRGLPLDYNDGAAAPSSSGRSRKGRSAPPATGGPVQCDDTRRRGQSCSTAATCCGPCTTARSWTRRSPVRCCTRSVTCAARTTVPCATAGSNRRAKLPVA